MLLLSVPLGVVTAILPDVAPDWNLSVNICVGDDCEAGWSTVERDSGGELSDRQLLSRKIDKAVRAHEAK